MLRDLDEVLLPGVTHWQHPRYFAYFANTASDPGILAELLAAALNSVGFLWRTGPALTELELVVLDWLAQLLGLPSGWHGHIEDTASTSTFAALVAAREAAPGRRVVVCSEHAHSSVEKACRMAELELRKVPVDAAYRMRADALDLTGACAVVATVGTTSTTSVDPVPAIADACERAGAWLHVDAAYAGSAMVCPEFRWAFAGVERADSLVVNAHKWLFTPMDCSCFWSRRPEALRHAFSLVPEYLRTTDTAEVNLMDYSPVLGRRFRALKLWAVLRCHGREGLQALIREHVRLAALFEGWVRATPGWEVCAPRPFSVVCFRREGQRRGERRPARAREPHAARSSSPPRSSRGARSCGWRSATPAPPRRTCARPGRCSCGRPGGRRAGSGPRDAGLPRQNGPPGEAHGLPASGWNLSGDASGQVRT